MKPFETLVRLQRARWVAAHGKPAQSAQSWAVDRYRRRNNIPPDQELTEEQIRFAMECERENWD